MLVITYVSKGLKNTDSYRELGKSSMGFHFAKRTRYQILKDLNSKEG